MNRITIVGIAALLVGSSAALAQPNAYANHYFSAREACSNPDRAYDLHQFRTGRMENVPVCLGDPATGMHIPGEVYERKYPWTDRSTWVYNPALDVWADNTPGKDYLFAQQNYGGDPRYSQNYDPRYSQNYGPPNRYNDSQNYRYRRYRN